MFHRLSLAAKGLLVLAVPVATLILVMLVFYQFTRRGDEAERAVEQTFEKRNQIRRLLIQMVNAETGIRGYLLTERADFLEPFEIAQRELPQIQEGLRSLTLETATESARVARMDSLVSELFGRMERTRTLIADGSPEAALAELEADKSDMDAFRGEVAGMIDEAERLLAVRRARARAAERLTTGAIFFGGILGLAGGIVGALVFARSIASRVRHVEDEARDVAAGMRITHEVRGDDEIARLERTLQQTSELLNQRAEEVRLAHNELESRVEMRTSELQTANEELRVSNEIRQAVIQSSPLAIWTADREGIVTLWNPAAEQIFGWSEAEAIGRPLPIMPPEDLAEHREWLERFTEGDSLSGVERKRLRKDGSSIDMMVWTVPLRDREGQIRGTISIDSDISEQKSLEEQFRQSQKLEAVGRLAGGVAHDFNNLLTVIQGYSEMIAGEAEGPLLDYAREIQYASSRASALTTQLLAFSRRQVRQPKVLDLNEVVAHSLKLLQRVIGEDIEIVTRLDRALRNVKVDPIHIDQVIMNLVVNARDAMANGGRLTIETQNQWLDADYGKRHIGVPPGGYAMIAISDTGAGMTPETRSRLFEPFFTTKESGKGTGLGLSIVYGIVKQNQGEIMVYSEPAKGTTFKIYLPAVDEAGFDTGEPAVVMAHGSETVLLCEDEDQIRDLVGRMLAMQGYQVLVAASPAEAIETSRRCPGPIHLLLTDVVMPRMNGLDLAREITRSRPETRVLYMSGYTDAHIASALEMDRNAALLQKPFTPASLSSGIRRVLGRPGEATSRGALP